MCREFSHVTRRDDRVMQKDGKIAFDVLQEAQMRT